MSVRFRSGHACLRVGKKLIHVAIGLATDDCRLTLLIAIEAAIAHGTFVAATFDAERIIPGLSRIRHQTYFAATATTARAGRKNLTTCLSP